MPNTEALVDTFEYILTHPKEWNQAMWACGTSYCYAGTAAVHIFGAVLDDDNDVRLTEKHAALLNRHEADDNIRVSYGMGSRPWAEGDLLHVGDFAAIALGLTTSQSDNLFNGNNTLTNLKDDIEHITGVELPGV